MSSAFATADRQVGGGQLYRSVVHYLKTAVAPHIFTVDAGEDSSAEVFSAAASLTEIAGWMAHDGGADHRARRHFDHAYRLAGAARNPALTANVCASMSHLASQLDQPRDAVRIADAGLVRAEDADGVAALRARLLAMRARGLAVDGNRSGCLNALELAGQQLEAIPPGPVPGRAWISGFDLGSLASEMAFCYRVLGELADAEEADAPR